VDTRSDIFAVGCVLYEMLAGEPPFTGPTPQAIVIRSMTEAPRPLTASREGITPAIEAVVTRALAKNPADRWQTAAEFVTAIGNAYDQLRLGPLSGARTPAPQPVLVPGPSAAKVWGLFGGIGALALALVYGLVQRWGLPVWALGLAVLLLAIGAVVLVLTGKAEARRAAGQSVSGLAERLTWKNATLGGLGALGLWAVVATVLVFRGPGGSAGPAGGLVRLAVLPFENRGDPADNYFVDGMTDQVRGKLMSLAGFQVTARTSSDQYKASTKPPQQIGKELGVDYLLTSTVTWIKTTGAAGKGRVQVVPELIAVKTGAGAWQQSFDAELTDIFQVQGNIATQVAGALNVALAPKEKQELAERPTQNLGAYDLFLKGKAVIGNDPASLRQAVSYFEQAVTLDSTFTEAWARMGTALTQLYFNGTPTLQVAERARAAVERAKALDPNGVIPLAASSRYHYLVENNLAAAEADAQAAIRLAPNDVEVLRLASQTEQILGRWPESLARLETARRLDPRSLPVLRILSFTLTVLRKYPEAEAVVREALAQAPTDLNSAEGLVFIHLMQGDLAAARGDIRALPAEVSRPTLVSYFALYQDLYWVLEEEDQKLVLRLTPSAFDDDRAVWATTLLQLAALRGDQARARALADTAHQEYEKQLQTVPKDPQRHLFNGLALAVLGRKADAIREAELGASFTPLSADQTNGAYYQHQLIRVYLLAGEKEKALDKLEELVRIPYVLSPGYLRIDPNFAPLKGNPRFEKLLRGG
jgi:TolB-like protein/protein involved in temperature-dependent protein secretion